VVFESHLRRWALVPDGEALHTHSSDLLPVRYQGRAAMLKVAHSAEEQRGNALMVWWNGRGAARVLEQDGAAVVLERLDPHPSLTDMVERGQDEEATRILCRVAGQLPRTHPQPGWPTLNRWFQALERAAPSAGGVFVPALATARALLAEPQEVGVLHGDLHHGNVLFSPGRGWLAIDPKGLTGERGYDHANILCNPTLAVATRPGRLTRQAHVIAQAANLDYARVLRWTLAYAGLSAAWSLVGGAARQAEQTLEVARLAAAELGA
jgi:streptomycin 6-kinase